MIGPDRPRTWHDDNPALRYSTSHRAPAQPWVLEELVGVLWRQLWVRRALTSPRHYALWQHFQRTFGQVPAPSAAPLHDLAMQAMATLWRRR